LRNPAQGAPAQDNVIDTYRESQCVPGKDPGDINQGNLFVFLKKDATERMRRDKRKVRYIFSDEEEKKAQPEPQLLEQKAQQAPQPLINPNEVLEQKKSSDEIEEESKELKSNIGESGQTPEVFQRDNSQVSPRIAL